MCCGFDILAGMSVQVDELIRSRRRTIAIQIRADGRVIVRAPLRTAQWRITEFVESKAGWIRRKKAEALKQAPLLRKEFNSGERFLFLGQEHPLRMVEKQRPALTLDDGFNLTRAALPKARTVFERWYRAQALRVLTERVKYYAARHNFKPGRVRISSARTRWGSCSSKGTLSFTWRLVMAPPEVIDYVVLHELVHLKVHNHSQTFWKGVAELLPGYKQQVNWLKKNGRLLTLGED